MILGFSFEGVAPWWAAYNQGRPGIVWHVFLFICILSIWLWTIAMTVAYSDTITTSLALSFSLFLGDFGISSYITDGYTFQVMSGIGLILIIITGLWLLKRLIAVNCAERFGSWCSWGNEGITTEGETGEGLMELPELYSNKGNYGSADNSKAYVDLSQRGGAGGETPKKKKKKKAQQQPMIEDEEEEQ